MSCTNLNKNIFFFFYNNKMLDFVLLLMQITEIIYNSYQKTPSNVAITTINQLLLVAACSVT